MGKKGELEYLKSKKFVYAQRRPDRLTNLGETSVQFKKKEDFKQHTI